MYVCLIVCLFVFFFSASESPFWLLSIQPVITCNEMIFSVWGWGGSGGSDFPLLSRIVVDVLVSLQD